MSRGHLSGGCDCPEGANVRTLPNGNVTLYAVVCYIFARYSNYRYDNFGGQSACCCVAQTSH